MFVHGANASPMLAIADFFAPLREPLVPVHSGNFASTALLITAALHSQWSTHKPCFQAILPASGVLLMNLGYSGSLMQCRFQALPAMPSKPAGVVLYQAAPGRRIRTTVDFPRGTFPCLAHDSITD